MSLIQWIPENQQPLVLFLCHLGLLSFAYSWIVVTITGIIGAICTKLKAPFDVGALIRFTLGHYLLTAMTILAVLNPVLRQDGSSVFYSILATVFLWITLAPELYEEYAHLPNEKKQRSRIMFVLRFALFVFWITAMILGVMDMYSIVLDPLPAANQGIQSLLLMQGSVGIILGALGAYGLFRSIFKGIFATFGLLGELRDLLKPSLPAQTLP